LGAICLLIVPVLNGKPLLFPDARSYYLIGEKIAETIGLDRTAQSAIDLAGRNSMPSVERVQRGFTAAATRSPYYSLYLWALERVGGLWLVVAAQALIAAFVVQIFSFAAATSLKWGLYWLNILALTVLSPLPLLIGFIMPDVFTGIGIMAAICLLLYPDRISKIARAALWLILLFSVFAHSTHILLILLLAAAGYPTLRTLAEPRRVALRRAGALAATGLVGIGASSVYGFAVQTISGERVGSAPFAMARVIADGPGRAYLSAACARDEKAYTLCRYKDRDMRDSHLFLWNPEYGVFGSADNETRKHLTDEQMNFVIWNYCI
jgi:hypothetical protein